MNKEITCRMIDGKPVVICKEHYASNRGDIVKIVTDNRTVLAVHGKYNHYQAIVLLGIKENPTNIEIYIGTSLTGDIDSCVQATPEEAKVMHYILNENGYQLVNGEVKEKRWIPAMDEKYWHMVASPSGIVFTDTKRSQIEDHYYANVFKTEQAALFAADKLNELLLTLPQE